MLRFFKNRPTFAAVEGYIVSARKYRPDTFDSVVGQSHVTDTLKNAIRLGQLAHAFLFSGPRGVGKTTCARILAKAINCENRSPDGEPCNQCNSCTHFIEGRSLSIHELDAASNNSVEDIRNIIEQVRYIPAGGKRSVFIIDEVHMLSQAAFNAFLKTLEEPPDHALFILATTEKHKILPTILSRCQKFDFRRIKVNDTADHLRRICEKEDIQFEYEGLQLIALKADGALRDALSIFDQIVSFSNRNVSYKVVLENLNVLDYDYFFKAVDLAREAKHEDLLLMLNEIIDLGFDVKDFMVGLTEHFRNLLVAQTPKTVNMLETSDNVKQRYLQQTKALSPTFMLNAFQLCSDSEQKLKYASNARLLTELALIKLAHLQEALDVVISSAGDGEKKKPLKQQSAPGEGEEQSPSSDLNKSAPPVQEKTAAGQKTPARKGVLNIPNSLSEIKAEYKSANAQEAAEEKEAGVLDKSVSVSPERFTEALQTIAARMVAEGKYNLAAALKPEFASLTHNQWVHRVFNESTQKMLDMEKQVVTLMREMTGAASLYLEIRVESQVIATDAAPYTNKEKLKLMIDKNPELDSLIKRLDLNINY